MGRWQEKILFRRLKLKDRNSFGKAYDLYVDDIFRFIYFKVGSREEAEDLTSSVFLKTWHHIQQKGQDEHKTVKPLLYRIARNSIIDHYRQKSSRPNVQLKADGEGMVYDIPDEREDIARKMEIASEFDFLGRKMLELKEEYRDVIMLRYIEELSIAEIARILNKSKGNIRVLSYRAIKALKSLYKDQEAKQQHERSRN